MTKVIFRVDTREHQREVIAVFPDQAGDLNPYRTCGGYVHMGQHTTIGADVMNWTRPARPDEYADLLKELESIGYNDIKIMKRFTRADLLKRQEQTK